MPLIYEASGNGIRVLQLGHYKVTLMTHTQPLLRDGTTEGRATKGRKTECRRPEVEKLECRRLKVERPNVERLNVEEAEHRKI